MKEKARRNESRSCACGGSSTVCRRPWYCVVSVLAFQSNQARAVSRPERSSVNSRGRSPSAATAPRLVRVAREGEAFAIASGLWLGGATPVVVIQNTGLLESGDALRGTASRMGVPLVMLVGYRGWAKMEKAGRSSSRSLSREDLVRAELDSVALMTEPTLAAWGVPFERLAGAADRGRVTEAFQRARAEERPVALLLTHTLG